MKKIAAVFIGILCIFSLGVSHSSAGMTLDVTVDGQAMPWLWDATTLNPSFEFGVQDGTNPTVVSSSSGFSFAPGDTFTISYVSGLTTYTGGAVGVDANGYVGIPFDNLPGSSGNGAPSLYMNPATYPINLMELVGTFADSSGNIVGTPFAIGDGPTLLTVPVGATQLQMGVNDDIFSDDTGSLVVRVSVPEPSTFLLLGSGLAGVGIMRRKFKK